MAGLGINHADEPVRGDATGDPPVRRRAFGVVVILDELDVPPGDQGQQPDGVGGDRSGGPLGHLPQHRQGISHQRIDKTTRAVWSFQAILGLPGSS